MLTDHSPTCADFCILLRSARQNIRGCDDCHHAHATRTAHTHRHGRRRRRDVSIDGIARACGGIAVQGTGRSQRREARHFGDRARRGTRRTRRRLRTAPGRLRRQGSRIQPSRRRTFVDACAAATNTPNSADSNRNANSIRACTSIRARGACRITTSACSITRSGSRCRSKHSTDSTSTRIVHSEKAFGGKPQRYRHVQTDYRGHVAELLAKTTNQGALDSAISHEDKEKLLESLRHVGRLDKDFRYVPATNVSTSRGFDVDPGGGLSGKPVDSKPIGLQDLLQSNLWNFLATDFDYDISPSLFQPVGGMDRIAMALHQGDRAGRAVRRESDGDPAIGTTASPFRTSMRSAADRCRPRRRNTACARFRCRSCRRSR